MVVSEITMKFHMHHILCTFQVNNPAQSFARAIDLELI